MKTHPPNLQRGRARRIRYAFAAGVILTDGILIFGFGRDPAAPVAEWLSPGFVVLLMSVSPILIYLVLVRTWGGRSS